MSGISFPGLGSGLQVGEIVGAIVNAERVPYETRHARQQGAFTTDISAVGTLKSAVEDVNSALEGLGDIDKYQQRTSTGRDDFIGVSSAKDAEIGSYSVKVNNLASNHKLLSSAMSKDDPVGEGTLTISSGDESFDIAVSATANLEEIRDAINDNVDNSSVSATIITDENGQRLVLSSKETGVENAIKVVANDVNDGNNTDASGLSRLAYDPDIASPTYAVNMQETSQAQDASITIDGTVIVTSATNEFKSVIDGIDITAKKVHDVDDDISNIAISENNNNIEAGLNAFVTSFNSLVELSDTLGKAGEGQAGPLAGDSMLRNLMTKFRAKFNEGFETSTGDKLTFSELGVRTERDGKLSLDKDILSSLVDEDVGKIQSFFIGGDEKSGFTKDVETFLGFYTGSDGVMQQRIDGKNTQIEKLNNDLVKFQEKMTSLETRLYAQYNAMDLVVAQMNSTSSFLQSQLENMPGVVKQSS